MDKKELNPNAVDVITTGVSAAVGMIPVVGGVLSPLVQMVIPNQRQDRIVKFITEISEKLEEMEYSIEQIEKKFTNYKYGAFTYKCINSVVNDMYDEKIQYYKNLCLNGLTSEEIELNQIERILQIFSEMDYFEILYLKIYYYTKYYNIEQIKKIQNELGTRILKPNYTMNMPKEEFDKETLKQITLNNLSKNGLLDEQIKNTGNHGRTSVEYKISNLGELILKKIDII